MVIKTKKSEKKGEKKSVSREEARITELTLALKQVQADFENYKKRIERDRTEHINYAGEAVLKKFLPILDNLDLALGHSAEKNDFHKGIEMIYANIIDMLESEGVKPIPAQGLPFDPFRHEALMQRADTTKEGTVLEIMQKGYTLHDKVLRPTKVVVSKGQDRK